MTGLGTIRPVEGPPIAESFRAAMRRIASTVTVLTAADGDEPFGMTATAVTSLSMEPPSLIVCVNGRARFHAVMQAASRFCVNVLHADQSDLSRAFGGAVPTAERFSPGSWLRSARAVPYLVEAQANMFCRRTAAIPYGTHTIFIGEVEEAASRDVVAPLVYQDAAYCVARPAAG